MFSKLIGLTDAETAKLQKVLKHKKALNRVLEQTPPGFTPVVMGNIQVESWFTDITHGTPRLIDANGNSIRLPVICSDDIIIKRSIGQKPAHNSYLDYLPDYERDELPIDYSAED